MELKTLKDYHNEIWEKLKEAKSPLEKEFLRGKLEQIENDRQEAIKWIKEIQKTNDIYSNENIKIKQLFGGFESCEFQGYDAGDFIKHFFNITEKH